MTVTDGHFASPEDIRARVAEAAINPDLDWRDRLLYKNGRDGRTIRSGVANVITILRNDVTWHELFAWDERACEVRMLRAPKWSEDDATRSAAGIWQEADTTRLVAWLDRTYSLAITPAQLYAALVVVAERKIVNPIRDYLEAVKWDGRGRVSTWLSTYLGSPDTAYTRFVGQAFLVSAVARIFNPGCKVDTMPVLEGNQGVRKSTALRALFGADHFNDSPLDLESKDRFVVLARAWLHEFSELDALVRAELERVKGFVSSRSDTFRPPYGRTTVTRPRSCVFAGSTNAEAYLRDETGNRRFWPVPVGRVDVEALERDRDQLWAEVVHLFRAGARWWAEAEAADCEAEQSKRLAVDAWVSRVRPYLAKAALAEHPWVTVGDVLQGALDIPPSKWTPADQARVARVLRVIGWVRKQRRCHDGSGDREYGYTILREESVTTSEPQNESGGDTW